MDRGRVAVFALAATLILLSAVTPWWGAQASLPQSGNGSAELRLFSFAFRTSTYSCTAVLLLYPYGECPILGVGVGTANLSFYLFWALCFLAASFAGQILGLGSELAHYDSDILRWVEPVSLVLVLLSLLSFLEGVRSGRMEFIGPDPLYGRSSEVAWSIREGFAAAVAAAVVEFMGAWPTLRPRSGTGAPRSSRTSRSL